ncbi:pyridine nucleotide-disulfide oxidoreductase, putative [Leishmania panamensis]|uniref:Pyridine nucleotide-disulfide oxidoreductase, putative n=1 Tax=Leishmania panamensis TaxID=5679 RepID=A0A088RN19_LEIPA|nr:pyridine nucleotide-disulfide oxidoreductase, putative [Leishmania panamensis]AIN96624.1 pyridine nucleotide-disulfide oxidoreductase, putative [Leishmania panamensis]
MLWKFLVSGLVGSACSAYHRGPTNVSLALDPPTLSIIMDPSKDIVPIRAVIVGGGYAGSKMAYQLDSMFDVTHIDEKNFYELTNDIIPIITNPWKEDVNPKACRRMMVLHRYYLKRSNVVTGTVAGVDEQQVYLRDGRTVPYDLLFLATGERKPFPFQTRERTISGRVQELKRFNEFLQSCKKVAVVGGGPAGTSLAHDLASTRPDLQVHLFHQRAELLPRLPGVCRRHAQEKLLSNPNMHLHLLSRVTDVDGVVLPSNGEKADSSSSPTRHPCPGQLVAPPTSSGAAPESSLTLATINMPWWQSLLNTVWPPRGVVPDQYRIHYDTLQSEGRRQQSILQQVYYGKRDEVEECGAVQTHGVEENFDYVFALTGDTPRPIQWDALESRSRTLPNILREHETMDGHYRVSTLMQFLNHPNIFAVGRCTNLPVMRGYGASDIEARTLFRELNSVVNNPTTVFLHTRDGVQLSSMQIPRVHVRLGVDDAVGCTPWSGGMTGISSVHEFLQDRSYLMKEFQQPLFYKQQDQAKVKQRVSQWIAEEITDVVDFSHC